MRAGARDVPAFYFCFSGGMVLLCGEHTPDWRGAEAFCGGRRELPWA